MSLMGTLAKAAVGIAVAKGAQTVLSRSTRGASGGGSGGGLQDMLGQVLGGQSRSSQGGMSGGMSGGLGQLLEGLQQQNPNTQSGGLDALLGGLAGGAGGGLLGQLAGQLGGAGGSAGGLGGLGGLLGGLAAAQGGAHAKPANDFGSTLNDAMGCGGEPSAPPSASQDVVAGLLLSAMIQAAKSDGQLDGQEREKLMEHLGDISPEERAFVEAEFAKPVDAAGLARAVPQGLERQVYLMSILGIDLDNRNEANYLHDLAGEMGLSQDVVNAIHDQVGAPPLYS